MAKYNKSVRARADAATRTIKGVTEVFRRPPTDPNASNDDPTVAPPPPKNPPIDPTVRRAGESMIDFVARQRKSGALK